MPMSFLGVYPMDVVSGGSGLVRAGLESGKLIINYAKPTVEMSISSVLQATGWSAENPLLATCAAVGTTGVILLAAPGLATTHILSSAGFAASGIQAGSVAAAAHSWTGNIAAGSVMAAIQSAGAGGSGLVVVNGVAQLGGALMTLGSSSLAFVKAKM